VKRLPLWLRYAGVAAVLLVALLVGSNVLSPTPQSNAQRATALENTLKCPSCQDLSVAQSSSPSSLAVRVQVERGIAKGMSNEEIVAQLEGQYGNAVLLTPPSGGLSALLWLIPVLLVVGAGGIIVAVFASRRRSRRSLSDPTP
jgi:cytochrome c-type biogenesis protein CcmH